MLLIDIHHLSHAINARPATKLYSTRDILSLGSNDKPSVAMAINGLEPAHISHLNSNHSIAFTALLLALCFFCFFFVLVPGRVISRRRRILAPI